MRSNVRSHAGTSGADVAQFSRRHGLIGALAMVALVVSLGPALPLAQTQPQKPGASSRGDGVIAGQVFDGSTGQPIAGATVTLNHQPPVSVAPLGSAEARAMRMPTTERTADDEGRYQFDGLPVGRFSARASAAGYRNGYFGQQSPTDSFGSNAAIDLDTNDRVTDVTIRMWPASSIRGIVADERGEPIVGGRVQALRQEYIAGKPLWTRARIARPTDDRGAYVLSDLAPGEYLLAFEGLRNESSVGYDPAFHPASARASTATIVTLVPGQSRADVNIAATIRPAAGLVTVSGRLIGDGSPLPPMTVMLAPPDAPDPILDLEALTARSSANAEFLFPAVPPGEYRLIAASFPPIIGHVGAASTSSFSGYSFSSRSGAQAAGFAPPPSAPTWVLDRLLTVKGPLQGLALQMQQGAQIRGRVVLEGSGASSDLAVLRGIPLLVRPAYARELGRIPIGGVEPDGTFHTVGLPPGRYVIGLVPLSFAATLHGWYPVSLRVAGRETIGRPIELGTTDVNDVELVLGNRSMNVEGVVRGADGRPLPFARVILFPRDRALWNDQVASPAPRRIHHVVADRFGHYAAAWMPPGDYQLAAVTAPPEYWMAPDYLETLAPAATPVTLQPGDRRMVDLTAR